MVKGIARTMGSPIYKDFRAGCGRLMVDAQKSRPFFSQTNTPEFGWVAYYNRSTGHTQRIHQSRRPGQQRVTVSLALRCAVGHGSDSAQPSQSPAEYVSAFVPDDWCQPARWTGFSSWRRRPMANVSDLACSFLSKQVTTLGRRYPRWVTKRIQRLESDLKGSDCLVGRF